MHCPYCGQTTLFKYDGWVKGGSWFCASPLCDSNLPSETDEEEAMDGKLRIDEMYAFVSVDPTDDIEGVIGFHTHNGWMPMVGADTERVNQLMPIAQQWATALDRTIQVVRFTVREQITEITPAVTMNGEK